MFGSQHGDCDLVTVIWWLGEVDRGEVNILPSSSYQILKYWKYIRLHRTHVVNLKCNFSWIDYKILTHLTVFEIKFWNVKYSYVPGTKTNLLDETTFDY